MTTGHYLFKLLIPCSPVEFHTGRNQTFLHCSVDRRIWDRPAGLTLNHVKILLDSTVGTINKDDNGDDDDDDDDGDDCHSYSKVIFYFMDWSSRRLITASKLPPGKVSLN